MSDPRREALSSLTPGKLYRVPKGSTPRYTPQKLWYHCFDCEDDFPAHSFKEEILHREVYCFRCADEANFPTAHLMKPGWEPGQEPEEWT